MKFTVPKIDPSLFKQPWPASFTGVSAFLPARTHAAIVPGEPVFALRDTLSRKLAQFPVIARLPLQMVITRKINALNPHGALDEVFKKEHDIQQYYATFLPGNQSFGPVSYNEMLSEETLVQIVFMAEAFYQDDGRVHYEKIEF